MLNSASNLQKLSLVVIYFILCISVYFYVTDLIETGNLFVTWLKGWGDIRQWILALPAGICSAIYVIEELNK